MKIDRFNESSKDAPCKPEQAMGCAHAYYFQYKQCISVANRQFLHSRKQIFRLIPNIPVECSFLKKEK